MDFEVDFLEKPATTDDTNIRLSVRMYLDMGVQIRNAIERLAALVARIRLNGCVREFVASQVAWLTERSTAYITLKRLFSRMNSLFFTFLK